ncbi:MAG: LLM class flavin-dependent oxidoreductase [Pseudomonadales bacterium]
MELWALTVASPRGAAEFGVRAEQAGWHGMLVVDSQNLSGDSYVALAVAATRTTALGLGTGVTNSVTRHPAVTAAAITSVQKLSGGRACLGIGRGDSALAHLGRAPARIGPFEHYVATLQAYLSGQAVPFEDCAIDDRIAPPVASLELADTPEASRLGWLGGDAKVPVEVAATSRRSGRRAPCRTHHVHGRGSSDCSGASRLRAPPPAPTAGIRTVCVSAPT